MEKVTILSIAENLKISRNTVAKALNDDVNVSHQMKKRVINAALQSGYNKIKPEIAAKYGVISAPQKMKTVIVLILSDSSPFWTKIIEGINGLLQSEGYYVSYYFIVAGEDFDIGTHIGLMMDIVGLVVLSVFSEEFISPFVAMGVPTVYMDIAPRQDFNGVLGDVVLCEGVDAVCKITQGLLDQGLRRIGFIGDVSYSRMIKDRFDGYMCAMRNNNEEIDESIIFSDHVPYRYYDKNEIEEVVALINDMPDAIVCANDAIAMLLLNVLSTKGLRVPDDIVVTGYDDLEALIAGAPFLTTVHVEHEKLGQRIALQLLWRMKNPSFPPEVIIVRVNIEKRASSDKIKG